MMRFEHYALNVPDPVAMSRWYAEHCDARPVIANTEPPFAHFLADATGRVIMELYSNPQAPTPNYVRIHPLQFHVTFAVGDAGKTRQQLLAAGASLENDQTLDDGTRIVMLRDPWSVPLQLCQRTRPFGV